MKKNRDIPKSLKDLQSSKRLTTVKKVQDAINDITEDGGVVTKKRLIELTGLSNSTFSKPHVISVLKANEVCQFKKSKIKETAAENLVISRLYKEIEQLQNDKQLLQAKLQDKDIAITKIKKEHQELGDNYAMILGKIHLLMKRIEILDIDIGIDLDDL